MKYNVEIPKSLLAGMKPGDSRIVKLKAVPVPEESPEIDMVYEIGMISEPEFFPESMSAEDIQKKYEEEKHLY